uniref:Uncharacterized protein n=1 Tax=Strongyloides stercoralis TaxID=6248 RepID=A0A0K0E9C1_STRER
MNLKFFILLSIFAVTISIIYGESLDSDSFENSDLHIRNKRQFGGWGWGRRMGRWGGMGMGRYGGMGMGRMGGMGMYPGMYPGMGMMNPMMMWG